MVTAGSAEQAAGTSRASLFAVVSTYQIAPSPPRAIAPAPASPAAFAETSPAGVAHATVETRSP